MLHLITHSALWCCSTLPCILPLQTFCCGMCHYVTWQHSRFCRSTPGDVECRSLHACTVSVYIFHGTFWARTLLSLGCMLASVGMLSHCGSVATSYCRYHSSCCHLPAARCCRGSFCDEKYTLIGILVTILRMCKCTSACLV
jgi:hypothetical protein